MAPPLAGWISSTLGLVSLMPSTLTLPLPKVACRLFLVFVWPGRCAVARHGFLQMLLLVVPLAASALESPGGC